LINGGLTCYEAVQREETTLNVVLQAEKMRRLEFHLVIVMLTCAAASEEQTRLLAHSLSVHQTIPFNS